MKDNSAVAAVKYHIPINAALIREVNGVDRHATLRLIVDRLCAGFIYDSRIINPAGPLDCRGARMGLSVLFIGFWSLSGDFGAIHVNGLLGGNESGLVRGTFYGISVEVGQAVGADSYIGRAAMLNDDTASASNEGPGRLGKGNVACGRVIQLHEISIE